MKILLLLIVFLSFCIKADDTYNLQFYRADLKKEVSAVLFKGPLGWILKDQLGRSLFVTKFSIVEGRTFALTILGFTGIIYATRLLSLCAT